MQEFLPSFQTTAVQVIGILIKYAGVPSFQTTAVQVIGILTKYAWFPLFQTTAVQVIEILTKYAGLKFSDGDGPNLCRVKK